MGLDKEPRGELFFKIKHKDTKTHWVRKFFVVSADGTLCGWQTEADHDKGRVPEDIIDLSPYKMSSTGTSVNIRDGELNGFSLVWKETVYMFVTHHSLRQRWVDAINIIQKENRAVNMAETLKRKEAEAAARAGGKARAAKKGKKIGDLARADSDLRREAGLEVARLETEKAAATEQRDRATHAAQEAEARAIQEREEKEASKREKEQAVREKERAEADAAAKRDEAARAKEDAAKAKAELAALKEEAERAKAEAAAAKAARDAAKADTEARIEAEEKLKRLAVQEEKILAEAEKARAEAEKARADAEKARAEAKMAQIQAERAAEEAQAAIVRAKSTPAPAPAPASRAPSAAAPKGAAAATSPPISRKGTNIDEASVRAAEARREAERKRLHDGSVAVYETAQEKSDRLEMEEKVRRMMKGN